MAWFVAGAVLSAGTSFISSSSAAAASQEQANAISRAEGERIEKERINQTIRNSYNTALGQMNLALQKRRLSTQATDIRAVTLAAKGDVNTAVAATGSIGASTAAIVADIDQKSDQAIAQTYDEYEMAVENYNNELGMQVLNTAASAPTPTPIQQVGPSTGEMVGAALLGGLATFASNYASAKMKLGLGSPGPTMNIASPVMGLNGGFTPGTMGGYASGNFYR